MKPSQWSYVLDTVMKQPVPNFLLMVVMLQFVCKIKYLGVHLLSSKKLRLTLHEPSFLCDNCNAPAFMGGASIGAGRVISPHFFTPWGSRGYINSLQLFNNATCLQSCNVVFLALRHSTALLLHSQSHTLTSKLDSSAETAVTLNCHASRICLLIFFTTIRFYSFTLINVLTLITFNIRHLTMKRLSLVNQETQVNLIEVRTTINSYNRPRWRHDRQ